MIGVRNRHDLELVDAGKVTRVAGVQRQRVGDRGGSDERVVRSRGGLSAGATEGRSDPPERARRRRIERDRVEVGLGLLKVGLARDPLLITRGDVRAN